MSNASANTDRLAALRHLTLAEVQQRIEEIDAERAALALIRRSLAARDRARLRQQGKREEGRGK